jgi:hypothetical protein
LHSVFAQLAQTGFGHLWARASMQSGSQAPNRFARSRTDLSLLLPSEPLLDTKGQRGRFTERCVSTTASNSPTDRAAPAGNPVSRRPQAGRSQPCRSSRRRSRARPNATACVYLANGESADVTASFRLGRRCPLTVGQLPAFLSGESARLSLTLRHSK